MENQNQEQPDNHIDYFAPKILWTIIGVLLLVVAAGSVLWWQEIQLVKDLSQVKQACAQIFAPPCGSSSKSSQTADWKTYTNSEYGFQFKYPDKYKIKETSNPAKDWLLELKFAAQNNTADQISLSIYNDPLITPCEEDCISSENVMISGNAWIVYQLSYNGNHARDAKLARNNVSYIFDANSDISYKNATLDQILSTFKFTK
ncbi:MAG TPA: hypothetical protein VF974_02500 [Patescibacteria group bacterium]